MVAGSEFLDGETIQICNKELIYTQIFRDTIEHILGAISSTLIFLLGIFLNVFSIPLKKRFLIKTLLKLHFFSRRRACKNKSRYFEIANTGFVDKKNKKSRSSFTPPLVTQEFILQARRSWWQRESKMCSIASMKISLLSHRVSNLGPTT